MGILSVVGWMWSFVENSFFIVSPPFPALLRAESAMLLIYVFHGVRADSQFIGYLLICFFSQ